MSSSDEINKQHAFYDRMGLNRSQYDSIVTLKRSIEDEINAFESIPVGDPGNFYESFSKAFNKLISLIKNMLLPKDIVYTFLEYELTTSNDITSHLIGFLSFYNQLPEFINNSDQNEINLNGIQNEFELLVYTNVDGHPLKDYFDNYFVKYYMKQRDRLIKQILIFTQAVCATFEELINIYLVTD